MTPPDGKGRRVVVRVTALDIARGKLGPLNCPIARALRRTFKARRAYAGSNELRIGREWFEDGRYWPPPAKATEFMINFDHRLPVKPFTFMLRLP